MPKSRQRDTYVQGFLQAANCGDEDEILQYLKDGFNVNEMQEYDEIGKKVSALMLASENCHADCVETLLCSGADISQLTQHYTKAIVYASGQNIPECLRTLAAAGMYRGEECEDVRPQYKEITDNAVRGNFDKLNCLILDSEHSKQISTDGLWVNTLCFLILSGFPKDFVDNVIEKFQIDVNGCCDRGFTPLISAVLVGDVETIDLLIRNGADINKVEDFKRNAKDIECRWTKSLVKFSENESNSEGDYLPFSNVLNSDGKSPLMYAVWTGKLNVVRRLLMAHGLDIECSDSQHRTALVHAVYAGKTDILDEILSHGVNVNTKISFKKRTVLFDAVEIDNENILKRLATASVNFNESDRFGMTALMYAAERGKARSLKTLLEIGDFNINLVDLGQSCYTALMFAAHNEHEECLKILLDYKADMDIGNTDGETVFNVAAESGNVSCLELLIKRSEALDGNHEHELRIGKVIHSAAKSKNVEMLKLILPFCKNIDAMDEDEWTALMHATNAGRIENIKLLLENGADVNTQNCYGETAIWLALREENMDCFEFYIERGADVNYLPPECDMLLVSAAEKDDIDYLEIILEKGIELVNTQCRSSGKTPLIAAVKRKNLENTQLLLGYGADVNIPDKRGMTAAMHAARWPEGLKLLIKCGADLNVTDEYEDTVWFSATTEPESLKTILEDGSVFDKESKTRTLKLVHKDSGISMTHGWNVKCLKLLFEYGVFEWDRFLYGEQIDEIDKIAFAALNVANNSPVQFKDRNEKMTSLLQEAFLADNIRTVRYLLANLFLTIEDCKTLLSDPDFQKKMRELEDDEANGCPDTVSYFNHVSKQPWRLETLSFLFISSTLNSSSLSSYRQMPSRSDQIDALGLPEILKSKLKFENAVRKLCPRKWETIGVLSNGEEENLLAVMRPLYPLKEELVECDEKCTMCYGCGFVKGKQNVTKR